jgi:hypothetical protein
LFARIKIPSPISMHPSAQNLNHSLDAPAFQRFMIGTPDATERDESAFARQIKGVSQCETSYHQCIGCAFYLSSFLLVELDTSVFFRSILHGAAPVKEEMGFIQRDCEGQAARSSCVASSPFIIPAKFSILCCTTARSTAAL